MGLEQRRSPRVRMQVECKLHRHTGSPVTCQTLDVGPGGMCVASARPLAADEELGFELAEPPVAGRARVLRQAGYDVYAVRFEGLRDDARAELERLVTAAAPGR